MSSFAQNKNLPRAVLETLVYFDLFSHPLTTFEIWKNLRMKSTYREVAHALRVNTWLAQRLEGRDGTWRLRGRTGERAARYRFSKHKIDMARKFVKCLRFAPGLIGVYACNTLGFLGSREESDIDLFIVTRRGRIWTVRFFAVMIAKLLFRRPHGAHTKDAICLSFFAREGADMKKLALPGGDVYYEFWLKNLLPLTPYLVPSPQGRGVEEGWVRVVEQMLRWLQLQMMPAHLKAIAKGGTNVVLSDEFLKFHDHDQRAYFQEEFERRVAAVA